MLGLFAWFACAMLCVFPAHATSGVHDDFPKLINSSMTMSPNGQVFGYQICPLEDYNAASASETMNNRYKYGLFKRIVYCVQGLVIPATYQIMYINSVNYFYGPIAAACTLAMVLWGYLMAVGKNSAPMRDAMLVAIKIGAVSFFTFMLGQSSFWPDGLFPIMIAVVDDLIRIVTDYIGYSTSMRCAANLPAWDVWGRVDCSVDTLVGGLFDPALLLTGLVGFFVSALFSGAFGLFIALAGFATIFFLIYGIIRATYITITAYVAMALMAIVSPIFITLVLFNATRAYFEKWLKLTIGFMLQPLFLFAYLAMMLAAYDTVIYDGRFSVYRAIVPSMVIGNYPAPLNAYPPNNSTGEFFIGKWLLQEGVYQEADKFSAGVDVNPRLQQHVEEENVGILGSTGAKSLPADDFNQKNAAGLALSVIDQFRPMGVYKVDIPFKQVSFQRLALYHLCTNTGCTPDTMKAQVISDYCAGNTDPDCPDQALNSVTVDFIIQLFLSLLIAVLSLYLFYLMLDLMPFIGAGVSGESYSMPVMGAGKLGVPGNGWVEKLKASMNMGGGK